MSIVLLVKGFQYGAYVVRGFLEENNLYYIISFYSPSISYSSVCHPMVVFQGWLFLRVMCFTFFFFFAFLILVAAKLEYNQDLSSVFLLISLCT